MANATNKKLLVALRNGDFGEAFDAGKILMRQKLIPIAEVIDILHHAEGKHNRTEAAYTLSWMLGKNPRYYKNLAVSALLEAFNNQSQFEGVRAQALEGFVLQQPKRRTKLWLRIESAVLSALSEESVEIRFWACYAAGNLRLKSALPKLKELAEQDTRIYPGWWRVSEEAEDAIEWVHGRVGKERIPMPIEIDDN
jgi:hypothetical protein